MASSPLLSTVYYARVTNTQGGAVFDRLLSLEYTKTLNGISQFTFTVPDNPVKNQYFTTDALVQLYRAIPGILDFYVELEGFHIAPLKKTASDGTKTFTSRGVGLNDLLTRRIIAWPKGSHGAAKSDFSDRVMRSLTDENCGGAATVENGRLRNGVWPGFATEANPDTPLGQTYTGDVSDEVLFDVLKDIADHSGLFFSIVSSDNHYGNFTFKVSGVNAISNTSVIFSVEQGTVQAMEYEEDRSGEKNVVYTTGKVIDANGNEVDTTVYVESDAKFDSTWNDREGHVGGVGSSASLQSLLDLASVELQARQKQQIFRFTPLQTVRAAYGKHFKVGDLVTTRYGADALAQFIFSSHVTWQTGQMETIELELKSGGLYHA